jgi:hypothetical protein
VYLYLKAIFSRTADRVVDRKLCYIEPDPETFSTCVEASKPNLVQTVLASMIGIPGYESMADDLKLLKERNSKLMPYQRLVKRLQPECAPSGPAPASPRAPTDGGEAATSIRFLQHVQGAPEVSGAAAVRRGPGTPASSR